MSGHLAMLHFLRPEYAKREKISTPSHNSYDPFVMCFLGGNPVLNVFLDHIL